MLSASPPKRSRLPSGDHVGSCSSTFSDNNSSDVPPLAEIKKILKCPEEFWAIYAILVPSGDQRGIPAAIGAEVSCSWSVPSARLRKSVRPGMVTYVIHWRSREKSSSLIDALERNGKNCSVLPS